MTSLVPANLKNAIPCPRIFKYFAEAKNLPPNTIFDLCGIKIRSRLEEDEDPFTMTDIEDE